MQTFIEQLRQYKTQIDSSVDNYVASQGKVENGLYADNVRDAYFDILKRGGKRIRGALVIVGYEMLGGKERSAITEAALAVELMHAYILVIDDIQDRSDVRRSGPTVHRKLENLSKNQGWKGEHGHSGEALALNAALIGAHSAQNVFASLSFDSELRLKAMIRMNQAMIMTAHGQTDDIVNEIAQEVTESDVERALTRKTAHYTILNPLQVGMTLAGANDQELESINNYAIAVGKAFQISDDLLIFEDFKDKDPAGDIKEGKMTVITHFALENADDNEAAFLRSQLGNQAVTAEEFERCREVLRRSGAEEYARSILRRSSEQAISEAKQFSSEWGSDQVEFLQSIAEYLVSRKS
jgi:geranylgeranyl diphosphate synthase type I